LIYNINGCECNFALLALKNGLVSVEITPEGPAYGDEMGADGSVCRYATNECRATANIVLKGFSKENAKLSAICGLDRGAFNGAGVAPFLFKDGAGSSLYATDEAWIMGMPAKTFGDKAGDVTWAIRLVLRSPLNWVVGGNG
jgi:hypothetical protein